MALGEVYLTQALGRTEEKAKEFTFRDAQSQFEKALTLVADDADAVAGLARTHWLMGNFDRCLEVVDAALEKKPSAQAYFWQGQAYYEQARARYGSEPQAEATVALFRKARGAYEASVKLDPAGYDAWMQLAYASQYLGGEHVAAALEAYKQAAALDGESRFPLLGIDAVLNRDQTAYVAFLEKLSSEQPTNAAVHYFLGFAHLNAQRWDAAVKSLTTYTTKSRRPEQPAFLMLGRAHTKAGAEKEAVQAFEKALELSPRDVKSAEELDARLRAQHVRASAESVSNAKACLADYERLTGLTPAEPLRAAERRLHPARGLRPPPGRRRLAAHPQGLHGALRARRQGDRGLRLRGPAGRHLGRSLRLGADHQRHGADVPVLRDDVRRRQGRTLLPARARAERGRLLRRLEQPEPPLPGPEGVGQGPRPVRARRRGPEDRGGLAPHDRVGPRPRPRWSAWFARER